jgi:hypothetical protein
MKRGRPKKPDIADAQPRPAAEELFDQTTVEKLDRLSVPEVEDAPDIETKLAKVPTERRSEAAKAMKSYVRRMRRYVFDGEEGDS